MYHTSVSAPSDVAKNNTITVHPITTAEEIMDDQFSSEEDEDAVVQDNNELGHLTIVDVKGQQILENECTANYVNSNGDSQNVNARAQWV